MKIRLLFLCSLLFPALLATAATATNCGCACCKDKEVCCCQPEKVAENPEPGSHPVKGVVTALMPDKTALMVKHEEVPGVMRAMTMMFKVDPAVLEQVKKGDAISAHMARRTDGWWLTAVEVIPTAK